jgi:hypothetical protein
LTEIIEVIDLLYICEVKTSERYWKFTTIREENRNDGDWKALYQTFSVLWDQTFVTVKSESFRELLIVKERVTKAQHTFTHSSQLHVRCVELASIFTEICAR